jgi:DNA-binding MarR family transcriptional regulator
MTASSTQLPEGRFIDDYLLYLLARASHLVSAEFHQRLRNRGVAVPVWRVLASLVGKDNETVTGLASTCLLQQPTMTKLLDRMERDGLVTRAQDQRDRRLVRVGLTDLGSRTVAELLAAAQRHEAELLARHPLADSIQLKELLRGIIARSGKQGGG